MRLVIEEAKDHTECMEKVRARHGADCVVVHSFKTDERYRVIIALETPASLRSPVPVKPVMTVAPQKEDLKPRFWLEDLDGSHTVACRPEDEAGSLSETTLGNQNYSIPQEITAELLALAARIKALESAQIHQRLAPEPQEAQSMLFSDVLQEMVSERSEVNGLSEHSSATQPKHPREGRRATASDPLSVTIGGEQSTGLRRQSATRPDNKDLPLALSNVSLAEEAKSFVSASKGAASFAALLTDTVASTRGGSLMSRFEMSATGH
jgi:flagellar biosynthesis GTPase FlhF